MRPKNNNINYIEFKANDLESVKTFYAKVFDWKFKDFGTTYVSFRKAGVRGGFEKTEDKIVNSVLVVLYHKKLDQVQHKIIEAGGKISKETFSFPGGSRFHFLDPSGNELAVWSDK